jgi:hypothetical protein
MIGQVLFICKGKRFTTLYLRSMEDTDLLERAKAVLERNRRGDFTVPAEGYPHQWLWDSCFVAVGLRHFDVDRAQKEILSLLRGQWSNGMLPNIIFSAQDAHRRDRNLWRSWLSPFAPDDVATSGITQPPMLAEAVVRIGEKLSLPERRTWYQTVYPALIAYHQWLYAERDPHGEGLVLQIHPWETGLDNTPPWVHELHEHQLPAWIGLVGKLHLDKLIKYFRRDIHYKLPGERLSTIDGLAFYSIQRRLRRKSYDIDKILSHSLMVIEDLTFNCIFIRANEHLRHIAKIINKPLPEKLQENIKKTEAALEQLWDAYSAQYYSREFVTHKILKEPSIATLMPLYSGSITKERAEQLVSLLHDANQFGAPHPVPSVPLGSAYFKPHGYWQGPSWLNTNWLIIDGLNRYGYQAEADTLTQTSLEMVAQSGFYEYFSPTDATPAGAPNFSWTAALTIDLLDSSREPASPPIANQSET